MRSSQAHSHPRLVTASTQVVCHECRGLADDVAATPVDLPLLGFVLHGWGKLHIDNRELATDAALVALLNAGDAYRVEHLQCTGRLCAVTVALSPELVEEALADAGASRGRTPMRPFANRLIPRDSGSQLLLYRILAAGETSSADHLQSEELALELVRGVLRRANEWKVEAPSATSARLASAAREILVTRFKEPLTLEAIAAELGCTKYHLCRIFRTCTGTTVFAYLTQLRLAAALRRLAGGEEDLSQLAYELGFSSHSHFTFAFRAAFGRTPSETRRYLPLS